MTGIRQSSTTKVMNVLAVRLGRHLHAIPTASIEEVLPALPIEPIPRSPDFVIGVVFVRGHLIPVLSAAERIGVTDYVRPPEPNIVCLRVGGRLIGVEVDEAIDLIDLPADSALSTNDFCRTQPFLKALVEYDGEVVRVLDPEKLVSTEEAHELHGLTQQS